MNNKLAEKARGDLLKLVREPDYEGKMGFLYLVESDVREVLDLNKLAELLQDTSRLEEAEPLMRRALAIDEKAYGPDHPAVAKDLNNLARLLTRNARGKAEGAPG